MVFAVFPAFFTSVLKAGAGSLGLVDGIAEFASNLFKIYSGALSDRFQKRKPLVVAGYALSVATRPFYILVASVGGALGLRVLDRVGKGLRDSPRDAIISLSTPREELGRSFGYHRAMDTAGAIIGPLAAYLLLRPLPAAFRHRLRDGVRGGDPGARLAVRHLGRGRRREARAGRPGRVIQGVLAAVQALPALDVRPLDRQPSRRGHAPEDGIGRARAGRHPALLHDLQRVLRRPLLLRGEDERPRRRPGDDLRRLPVPARGLRRARGRERGAERSSRGSCCWGSSRRSPTACSAPSPPSSATSGFAAAAWDGSAPRPGSARSWRAWAGDGSGRRTVRPRRSRWPPRWSRSGWGCLP